MTQSSRSSAAPRRPRHSLPAALVALFLLGQLVPADEKQSVGLGASAADGRFTEVLVSGYTSRGVHRFGGQDGTSIGKLRTVRGAQSIAYGPDRNMYLAAEEDDAILRLLRKTGQLESFVEDDPATAEDETGGLTTPTAAVFGPDGDLYVASFARDRVFRYDGLTGDFIEVFVKRQSGGLDGPDAGMCFGPDGHLYVPSFESDQVLRYDGATGDFLDVFMDAGEGGLANPRMLRYHDGHWFVSSWGSNRILRFDEAGEFESEFATLNRPTGFVFRQQQGDVLVTSDQSDKVVRFDAATGQRLDTLIDAGAGGLDGATFIELLRPAFYTGLNVPGAGLTLEAALREVSPVVLPSISTTSGATRSALRGLRRY